MNYEDDERGEVWRFLPEVFIGRYSSIVSSAFPSVRMGSAPSAIGRATVPGHQSRLSSGSTTLVTPAGASRGKSASASTRNVVGSENALAFKATIDRKLRKIARVIALWEKDADAQEKRRCSGRCKTWSEPDWLYCPACGAPTETVT